VARLDALRGTATERATGRADRDDTSFDDSPVDEAVFGSAAFGAGSDALIDDGSRGRAPASDRLRAGADRDTGAATARTASSFLPHRRGLATDPQRIGYPPPSLKTARANAEFRRAFLKSGKKDLEARAARRRGIVDRMLVGW
jgi:hypothetical protein